LPFITRTTLDGISAAFVLQAGEKRRSKKGKRTISNSGVKCQLNIFSLLTAELLLLKALRERKAWAEEIVHVGRGLREGKKIANTKSQFDF
jgi:hypothetical protein